MNRLRLVHTKDDNFKDNYPKKSFLILKNSSDHNTAKDSSSEKQYCWNNFQNNFI